MIAIAIAVFIPVIHFFTRVIAMNQHSPALLAFIAGGERWLVDPSRGVQVIDAAITPVPLARPWYLGLVRRRQCLFGAIDLGGLAGRPVPPLKREERLLVLPEAFGIALRVERVQGLLNAHALSGAASEKASVTETGTESGMASETVPEAASGTRSDAASAMRSVAPSSSPGPFCPPWLAGSRYDSEGQRWNLLDVGRLCSAPVFLQAGIGALT